MSELILASGSVYRQRQLASLGLSFKQVSPSLDESKVQQDKSLSPSEKAMLLAKQKSDSVLRHNPSAVVIAGDQIATFAGKILLKPESKKRAIEQLSQLSGETHKLVSAICVQGPSCFVHWKEELSLTMLPLSEQEIISYVDFAKPLDCAGSYKIEKGGIALFSKIVGNDFSAIEGLPLISLAQVLRKEGFVLFEEK